MKKALFAQVVKLGELWADDERWQANVRSTGVQDGYALAGEEDYVTDEIALGELELTEETMYNFMGSEYEQERFYPADNLVFKRKVDGTHWVLYTDELGTF